MEVNTVYNLSMQSNPVPTDWHRLFIIGESFIGNDNACLVLGDNIFYGQSFSKMLSEAVQNAEKEIRQPYSDITLMIRNVTG
jgi:Glucose-1-phosphate thymidylyltransferase (EC 2.7.7.24)